MKHLLLFSVHFFVGDFQFASLDRKIIELYDDLMSQVSNATTSKGNKRNFKHLRKLKTQNSNLNFSK